MLIIIWNVLKKILEEKYQKLLLKKVLKLWKICIFIESLLINYYWLGEVNNFSNGIYNRNELRRTKNSFFSRKKISNSTKKEEKHLNRNNSAKNIKRSELNLFNKDYKNNIKNDKQVFFKTL